MMNFPWTGQAFGFDALHLTNAFVLSKLHPTPATPCER